MVASSTANWTSLSEDIIFLAPQSPVELTYKPTLPNFVDQPLLVGKPRTQKIGLELREIKMVLKFHLFIMPFNKLKNSLTLAAANGTILTWVWGNGQVAGDYVIRGWEEKPKKTDETGQTFVTDIEIVLKEYAGLSAKQKQIQAAKSNAFAITNLTVPVTVDVVPPVVNPVTEVSASIIGIDKNTDDIAADLTDVQSGKKSLSEYKNSVQHTLNKINSYVNKANAAIVVAQNIKNGNNIAAALGALGIANDAMITIVNNTASTATIEDFATYTEAISSCRDAVVAANIEADVVKSWYVPARALII